jgi:hypothetical protein
MAPMSRSCSAALVGRWTECPLSEAAEMEMSGFRWVEASSVFIQAPQSNQMHGILRTRHYFLPQASKPRINLLGG